MLPFLYIEGISSPVAIAQHKTQQLMRFHHKKSYRRIFCLHTKTFTLPFRHEKDIVHFLCEDHLLINPGKELVINLRSVLGDELSIEPNHSEDRNLLNSVQNFDLVGDVGEVLKGNITFELAKRILKQESLHLWL